MSTTLPELQVKLDKLPTNLDRLDGIVNGPAEGAGSEVVTDNGTVKSMARVAAEAAVDATVAVEAAKDAALGEIEAEGTTQVGLVEAEGVEQVAAVEAKGVEKVAAVSAAANAEFYADTTAGIAGTTNGDYFLVVGDNTDTAYVLYLNNSGVADFVAAAPSLEKLDTVFAEAVSRDEVAAREGVDASWLAGAFGCNGTPIDGTAVGNATYILEAATLWPGVVTQIQVYGKNSGGTMKLRRFTQADATATQQGSDLSLTVAAGLNTLNAGVDFDPYSFNAGEHFGIFAYATNGKIAITNSAGSNQTPYRSPSSDFTGGSLGSVTSTNRLEVNITVRYANGSTDTFRGSAMARADFTGTGETIRFGRWTSTEMESDPPTSPQSVSANVGQFDPYMLPGGRVKQIEVRADAAGKAYIAYSTLVDGGLKHEKVLSVTLAAGKNTLIAGTHFPPNMVLPAGCVQGVYRPTSGGATVRWASANPADASNGERGPLFYYRTTAQPVEGSTQAQTVTATAALLMLATTIETVNTPRKRRDKVVVITDETFDGGASGTVPPTLQQTGGWTITAGNAASGTAALQNHLKSVIAANCHRRVGRVWFEFGDASSHVAAFMDSTGSGTVGSLCSADASADAFYARGRYAGSSSLTSAVQTDTNPFATALTTGRLYMIEMRREGRTLTYRMVDCVSGEESSFVIDATAAANHSLFQTTYGQFVGKFGVSAISGSVNVKRIRDVALVNKVRVAIFGDSIENANAADWATGWVAQLEAELGVGAVWSAAIDGSNARETVQRLSSLLQFIKPEYAIFKNGTNEDNTSNADDSLARWKLRVGEFIDICTDEGVIPVIARVPPSTRIDDAITAGGTLQSNYNSHIASLGVRSIRFDLALSASNDGTTMNGSLFADDAHPNNAGQTAMYGRVKIDLPELFDEGL